MQIKTFFQKLSSTKTDWDDLTNNDCLEEWNELVKSISTIEFIGVSQQLVYHKRLYCYHNSNDPVFTTELHGFSDVSMKACRCSIYLRFANRSKFVKVVLVVVFSRPWLLLSRGSHPYTSKVS